MTDDTAKFDLTRLIKLMKMTTVTEDTLAAVAIRAANRELDKIGTDWESLLRGKVTVVADPFAAIPTPPPDAPKSGFRPTPPTPRPAPTYAYPTRPAYTPPPTTSPPSSTPHYGGPPPLTPRFGGPNKFAGKCHKCRKTLAPYEGELFGVPGNWKVECNAGKCLPPRKRPRPTPEDLKGLIQ